METTMILFEFKSLIVIMEGKTQLLFLYVLISYFTWYKDRLW